MSNLSGKVALVTGASKGIGAAIAKTLAEKGAAVVVNYASSRSGADAVVAEIEKAGGRAIAAQADVSKAAQAKALVDATLSAFGRLDIWSTTLAFMNSARSKRSPRRSSTKCSTSTSWACSL